MTDHAHDPVDISKPLTGYLWGALAVLSCPCHLPILAVGLTGTGIGAFIEEHWAIAAIALTELFMLSLGRMLRADKLQLTVAQSTMPINMDKLFQPGVTNPMPQFLPQDSYPLANETQDSGAADSRSTP